MAPPLSAFLANERTVLEWIDMSITLGAVAAGLFVVGSTNSLAASGAHRLAVVVMPVAIAFAIYSGSVFTSRRNLLRANKLDSPDIQSTTGPVILALFLAASLLAVFLVDVGDLLFV